MKDGLSNTFFIGETSAAYCSHSSWYSFNGSTATCAIPLNYRRPGVTSLESARRDWPNNYSFFTNHPGTANFCLGDGAVKSISTEVDLLVYYGFSTISGNEVFSGNPFAGGGGAASP